MSPLEKVDQFEIDQPNVGQPKVDQPRGWRERTGSRLGTVLVLGLTAALVIGGAWLVDRPVEGADGTTAITLLQEGKGEPPRVGSPAQDFTATTVDGKTVSLKSLKGKAVWLSFGATWCAPCQAEAPDIQAAYAKTKASGVVVVGVFISEDSGTVLDYGTRIGLTFPQIADPDTRIASAYRVNGIPVHFFIDRSGVTRSIVTGGLSAERMDTELAAIS